MYAVPRNAQLLDLASMFVRPFPGKLVFEPFAPDGLTTIDLSAHQNQEEASREASLERGRSTDPGRFAALGATWRPDREDHLEVRVAHRGQPANLPPRQSIYDWIAPEHVDPILQGVTQAQTLGALTTGTLTIDRGRSHLVESNSHAFQAVGFSLVLMLWNMGADDNDW
jgi:hypothetical protein